MREPDFVSQANETLSLSLCPILTPGFLKWTLSPISTSSYLYGNSPKKCITHSLTHSLLKWKWDILCFVSVCVPVCVCAWLFHNWPCVFVVWGLLCAFGTNWSRTVPPPTPCGLQLQHVSHFTQQAVLYKSIWPDHVSFCSAGLQFLSVVLS